MRWFAGTEFTRRPWLRSHDTTASTSDELGEKRAWNCAGVRYCPYDGLRGLDTAAVMASSPAWSRKPRTTARSTRSVRPACRTNRAPVAHVGRPATETEPDAKAGAASVAASSATTATPM